ncbi:MAG: VCBS repeat-containing protein, partial [Deltaproteobacteria bacterium]|nr:VCBS repeat-containing protein [Deltaproteobacteria bacterium]
DVAWWENTAGNGTAWARRNIDTSFGGANSVYAADVDGDGDTDVVGAASGANDIAWWENTNGAGTAWTKRILDGNFAGAWSVYAADVDSDGDLDVLGAASVAGEVTWWENTAGDGTAWTKRTVSGSLAGARSVFAADVDSDGDMDILGAGYVADDVRWWENTTGDGTAWIEHIVDAAFNGTRTVYAADLDSDGDMDVLAGAYNADTIAWWENETIHRSAVHPLEHLVDGAFDNPRSVFAADVDDDGDTDLLGAANVGDDVAWWENTAGDGTAWTEHMIDPSFNAAARVFAGDVDGDGDLDALAVAGLADDVTWWENTAGDGSAWTEHTIDPFFNDVRGM